MAEDRESLERRIEKLQKINAALMKRVERSTDMTGTGYSLFETAIALETEVRARTKTLNLALEELGEANRELSQARNAAEAANRTKTRFLAAASHDLLQPLNAARLFLSSLSEGPLEPDQAAIVERVDRAFGSVEKLLGSLLDISKLDAGAVETSVKSLAVARVLDPIADELRPVAEGKGLRLIVVPSTAIVTSDEQQLRRLVQNLVVNAVRYTAEGRVLIGCRRRGDALTIEVWDSGVGIAEGDRKSIFEEFHRIEDGHAEEERGMGLGLAIVQRISRLLDHPLELRSEPGRGSMFSVLVPLGSADGLGDALGVAEEPMESPDQLIALLIENDTDVRDGMVSLLDRWGIDSLPTANGSEALQALTQLGMPPDVILADHHLDGGEEGLAVVARLRDHCAEETPAVLITAEHSEQLAAAAAAQGVHYLTKPLQPAKLRSLLRWASQHEDSRRA